MSFKTANIISDTCLYCKKLQKSNKSETENTCTVDITKQDFQSIQQVTVSNSLSEKALPDENDVTLCENDDNDMSIILNKIFPDCPDKMKTFLFSQKMALERHPKWASVEQRHCPLVFKSLVQEPSWLYRFKKQQICVPTFSKPITEV